VRANLCAAAMIGVLAAAAGRGAEADLVLIRLHHMPQQPARTYTVPAGKILMVELASVNAGDYGGTPSRTAPKLQVTGDSQEERLTITIGETAAPSSVSMAPWKLDEGWRLAVDPPVLPGPLGAGAYSDITLIGILLDKALLVRLLLGGALSSGLQLH